MRLLAKDVENGRGPGGSDETVIKLNFPLKFSDFFKDFFKGFLKNFTS